MISTTMNDKLNQQIAVEFSTAHAYLAMACAFERMGLKILARRFHAQDAEEREHAMKILRYVQEVGGTITLEAVEKPESQFVNTEAIVRAALQSEQNNTRKINALVALADSEKDYATHSFLSWFVDEQVEEEATMTDLLKLVELAGDNMLAVETRLRHDMAQAG